MTSLGKTNLGFVHDCSSEKTKPKDTGGGNNVDVVALKRELGLFSGVCLIVGTIIGSGIFVSPGTILQRSGSIGTCFLVWTACGLISLLGSFCYLELTTMLRTSGGDYTFIFCGLGALPAFIFAWTSCILISPFALSIQAQTFSKYLISIMRHWDICSTPVSEKCLAVATILLICFINCWSVRAASRVQNVFTVVKLISIVIIIVGGIVRLCQGHTQYLATGFSRVEGSDLSTGSISLAILSGMYSYEGWNALNIVVEELQQPVKNAQRAIFISLPIIIILYLLVNIAYLTVLSPVELHTSSTVAVDWSAAVLGPMSWIIPFSVAISTFGSANGIQLLISRVVFVAARENHLPSLLSFIHMERLTPVTSIIFSTILSILMTVINEVEALIDYSSFTVFMFHGLAITSLIILRCTEPNLSRPFRVFLPVAALMVAIAGYLVVTPLVLQGTLEYLYILIFIFAGLVLYVPFVHYKKECLGMKELKVFFQKLLRVIPQEGQHLE